MVSNQLGDQYSTTAPDYESRVADQVAQYASGEIHEHSPIYEYWSNTYLRPRLNSVLGVDSVIAFYVEHIRQRAARESSQPVRVLSIGAGDAELEIQIAQQLLSGDLKKLRLECLELSPILIERANQSIHAAGLDGHVAMVQADLNSWPQISSPAEPHCAVLAHHILHHIVELEGLFDRVAALIGDSGVFLATDMIGRNGHMRWPEALTLVNALWDTLPEELRYNHVFHQTDAIFNNWDCCSVGGFEGIRAQDILPLLVQRFRFEKFLAFGNLLDIFCDRFYGPNFHSDVPAHTHFIDSLEQLNSLLLELGVLKPTMMFAVMSNRGTHTTRMWKNLSPEFCVRDPANLDLSAHRQKSPLLGAAFKPHILGFGKGQTGMALLGDGWSYAEEWGTWMVGEEAFLDVPIPDAVRTHGTLTIRINAAAFIPHRLHSRSFSLTTGLAKIGVLSFEPSGKASKKFEFEMDTPASDRLPLRIVAHEDASPAEDGSEDHRSLGLALIDIVVY